MSDLISAIGPVLVELMVTLFLIVAALIAGTAALVGLEEKLWDQAFVGLAVCVGFTLCAMVVALGWTQ